LEAAGDILARMAGDSGIRRPGGLGPALLLGALLTWAAWPWLPFSRSAASPATIVFYGFSILGDTMNDAVFPAFQKAWASDGHPRVEFISSFAGSGTVTNQIIMGVPAQLALLSLESDADRLAAAGVVAAGSWRSFPHEGVVNRTPFIILVRPGNPKGIRDFEDLTRPGIGVVHPDPLTSGGAAWAIVAEYGAGARAAPQDPGAGERMLAGIWKNVVAQASSARAARTQFENGFGDALITYEQEALWDRARGRLKADIVYPRRTILSEHTLVEVGRHVLPKERAAVEAFERFLWSETAQRIFVQRGFRSVEDRWNDNPAFGRIAEPFLIADFGGWKRARREIVDGIWKDRVMKAASAR
jgi:sulfate transport system substrate-binding protein